MTAAYTPQPGTIPFRVITHLRTLPRGKKVSSAQLGEELGFDHNSLSAMMVTAVKAGAVKKSKPGGQKFLLWELGDGSAPIEPPAPEEEGGENDFEPDAPRATAPSANEAALQAWPAQPPAPEPAVVPLMPTDCPIDLSDEAMEAVLGPAPKPRAATRQAEPTFACALWSDGRLQLTRGNAELVQLTAEETRALLHYLDRIAVHEHAA